MFDASSLWLQHVVIRANKARNAGGIDIEDNATLYMIATTVNNNTAAQFGGAVYVTGNGSMSATACVIADNTAGQDGGGVFADGTTSLSVSQSVLLRNMAISQGGAMFLSGPAVNITLHSCTFTSNVAEFGGAFLVGEHAHASATSCVFRNNMATTAGGAIAMIQFASLVLSGRAQAVGNRADYGGFLRMEGDSHAEVLGATFARNTVAKTGGCVHALGNAVVVMNDSTIVGGGQQRELLGGGFAMGENSTVYVSACTISHLHARRGAGFYFSENSSVHARNCKMFDLTADEYGGGLFADTLVHSTWVGGSFVLANAKYGGAIDLMHGSLSLSGTTFDACSAIKQGGCIYAERTANASLTNCTMRNCTAVSDGGGALYVTDTARVCLHSCTIMNSSSMHFGGGAIAVFRSGSVHLQTCRLLHNQASTLGGAVSVEDTGHLHAVDCAFVNNTCAATAGGLAVVGNASVHLTRCLVSGCSAGAAGGMYLTNQAVATLVDTVITGNTAASVGGGVLLGSDGFKLSQIRAAEHNNTAPVQPDVSVLPTTLSSKNSGDVWGYVSRLRVDEGILTVTVLVTGPHGLPASAVGVTAVLEGVVLRKALSGDDGLVRLPVKLLKPPGVLPLNICHARCVLSAVLLQIKHGCMSC